MDNWIVANLNAAITFFSNCMSNLYGILMINPITYQDGAIWSRVEKIYDTLLGPCISIMMAIYLIGLIRETGDLIKFQRPGTIIWSFICMFFMSSIIIWGKYLLLLVFWIGRELVDKVCGKGGGDFISLSWIELPDAVTNATNDISFTNGIIFWVVTLICAIVVMVSCFTILFIIYGRLFKIYLHIALAPVAFATTMSKSTLNTFVSFVKSFVGVCLEGLVIVVTCIIFSAFAGSFDFGNMADEPTLAESAGQTSEIDPNLGTPEEHEEKVRETIYYNGSTVYTSDIVDSWGDMLKAKYNTLSVSEKNAFWDSYEEAKQDSCDNEAISSIISASRTKKANAGLIWKYLGEMMFLYLMMTGTIKGADNWVHQKLGL